MKKIKLKNNFFTPTGVLLLAGEHDVADDMTLPKDAEIIEEAKASTSKKKKK